MDEKTKDQYRLEKVVTWPGVGIQAFFRLVSADGPETVASANHARFLEKVRAAYKMDEPVTYRYGLGLSESSFRRWRAWALEQGFMVECEGKVYLAAEVPKTD